MIKRMLTRYYLWNKRLFKKYSFLLILCMVPLLVGGIRLLAKEESGIARVVLCLPNPEDELASQVTEKLMGEEGILRYLLCEDEEEARRMASENLYRRTVIFGLGTTGMFMGDLIRRSFPEAKILFVARSASDSPKVRFALEQCGGEYLQNTFASEAETAEAICRALEGRATLFIGVSGSEAEHRIAFEHRALGCNGVYNSFSLGPKISFDTMPFGFENHLIFGSINFRKEHMETAIRLLAGSRYDEIVELIDKDEFTADPIAAYENRIYAKGAPLKTAVVWNPEYIDFSR